MSLYIAFDDFYTKVKESIADGTFAKLTMAKTIGNTDLKNIYVRPIVEEGDLKLELKFRHQEEELFEIHTIENTCERLKEFVNNPFSSAILFTTEFDLVYKLNKKKAVSLTNQPPTFGNASPVILEYWASKK
ncbi:hypothetical protein [Flavobacterium sp.]|uniref:hypothetical protein n=1 Tax=Flavobacterium sp. TaxID=239 RepID=UPI002FDB4D03